ncbi:MAG: hypothetical protein AAGP08_18485 [Pseudomonadota bacterium]
MMRQAAIYGGTVAVAIFFVGWSTGMGGSFLPNLAFSVLIGAFAALCFIGVHHYAKRKGD